jgi:ParB family chromosome partitioning protein
MKKTKIALPSSKVDISLTAGSVEPAMKAAEAKSTKLFKVPVAAIKTIPGFNVRVQSADYLAHRDMIAASIKANGFDQTKPLSGYVAKEENSNVIYVTDGHTRLDAVNTINAALGNDATAEGYIASLPVLVHSADKSLTDLTVALHTSNTGRPLTPFEIGVVVKRLMRDEGADKATIAAKLAVTPRYLDDVLLLVNGPKEVRQAVLDGTVSSTLAIQELRKAGDAPEKAVEKLTAAVAKSGGKKVTKKALGPKMQKVRSTVSVGAGTDMKEIVKAVAALVRKALPQVPHATDPESKVADADGTINLVIEIPAPVEEPAPAKKPAAKKAAPAKAKAAPAPAEPAQKAPSKKAAAAKAAAEPAPKPKKGKKAAAPAETDDTELTAEDQAALGIEGAEEVASEDDEIAPAPIAVKNGEGVDDDDVDI